MKSFKNFEDYFNTLKKEVANICLGCNKRSGRRIEYDDLFQEATLKLLDNYTNGTELGINFSLEIVQNHLIDYIRSKRRDKEITIKDYADLEKNWDDPNKKTKLDDLNAEIHKLDIPVECKKCGKTFKRKRKGQVYCSSDCVKDYRAKMREMKAKYGDKLTKWLDGK